MINIPKIGLRRTFETRRVDRRVVRQELSDKSDKNCKTATVTIGFIKVGSIGGKRKQ